MARPVARANPVPGEFNVYLKDATDNNATAFKAGTIRVFDPNSQDKEPFAKNKRIGSPNDYNIGTAGHIPGTSGDDPNATKFDEKTDDCGNTVSLWDHADDLKLMYIHSDGAGGKVGECVYFSADNTIIIYKSTINGKKMFVRTRFENYNKNYDVDGKYHFGIFRYFACSGLLAFQYFKNINTINHPAGSEKVGDQYTGPALGTNVFPKQMAIPGDGTTGF